MEVLSSPSQGIIKSPNKYWVLLLFISSSAETLEFTFLPILFSHHPSSLPFKTICPLVPFLTGPIFFSVCCVTLDKLFNFSKPHLWLWLRISSVQSLSRVRLFVTPWTAAHQASLSITNSWSLLKLMSHRVGDAIQPPHPLSSLSPLSFNLSQHQGVFQWVSSLHQVAKGLELKHQSFQWIFRTDFL